MANGTFVQQESEANHSWIICEKKVGKQIFEETIGMIIPVLGGHMATSGIIKEEKTFNTEGEAKTYLINLYQSYKR